MSSKKIEIPDIYLDIFDKLCKNTQDLIQNMLNDIEFHSLNIQKNQVIFSLICSIYDFEQANDKKYDEIKKYIHDFNIVAKRLHEDEDSKKKENTI